METFDTSILKKVKGKLHVLFSVTSLHSALLVTMLCRVVQHSTKQHD